VNIFRIDSAVACDVFSVTLQG